MAAHAARGKKAIENSHYDEAIEAFTAALKEFPKSPDYLIQRSTAFQRAKKSTEALNDAEHAVVNAQDRGKRELIDEAQLRRGIVLFQLGKFGDADFLFKLIKQRTTGHKLAEMWDNKTAFELKKIDADDERRKVTVTETPSPKAFDVAIRESNTAASQQAAQSAESIQPTLPTPQVTQAPQASQTPVDQIRHEWYQNTETVYFTMYAKVPQELVSIEITEYSLNISFPLASGSTYDLTIDPLYGPVKTDKCINKFYKTKFEVILVKAIPGLKWSTLEGKGKDPVAASEPMQEDTATKDTTVEQVNAAAPAYPTSSKTGPKNWDKIVEDSRTADGKTKEDEEDDEGGDPSNRFFQKLFKGASPDVQRAMMKSYTESNGTALSTNWEEVSKGKVETSPPDGMEAKPW